jgi:predicted HAD superfamily Cof-like phosphohydrolase
MGQTTELDEYFEAWAATLKQQLLLLNDDILLGAKEPSDAVSMLKEELADAWYHRPGGMVIPSVEVTTFIAEQDPMTRLKALPFLAPEDPIGDLIARFESQGNALIESGKECDGLQNELREVVSGVSVELSKVGHASENGGDGVVLDVRRMGDELVQLREMVGTLLGIKYTRAGARECFATWQEEQSKCITGTTVPARDLPAHTVALHVVPTQGMTLGQVAYESFWNDFRSKEWPVAYSTLTPDTSNAWEIAALAVTKIIASHCTPEVAFGIIARFTPPFGRTCLPTPPLDVGTDVTNNFVLPPDCPGELIAIAKEGLLRLLTREAHLSRQVTELQASNTALVKDRRAYDRTTQVRELFAVVLPDQERRTMPGIPSDVTVRFRVRLIAEEFVELLDSVFYKHTERELADMAAIQDALRMLIDGGRIKVDLPEFIDACGDLDVVIEGARIAFGVDGRPIALAIHQANMAKKDGPKREIDGKRLKPPGWKPADIAGELHKQGWLG